MTMRKIPRVFTVLLAGLLLPAMTWLIITARTATAAPLPPSTLSPHLPTAVGLITLQPIQDTTLYESELGTISNGAGQHFFAGKTDNGTIRRGLLAFDLGAIPPGAVVVSASLTLTMSKSLPGDAAVALHTLSAAWGEGPSDALGEEGAGDAAQPGDATWLNTFYDSDLWATPGGDFDPAPSAITVVGGPGAYTWASPALTGDVAAWLADPATNFGWALLGDETANRTAKRFDSRENEPTARPRLTVTFVVESSQVFVPFVSR
ncbi:MAG: DNRLRE domain-containing protein [Anaerolineales bacterium]|nr:DNRLRE domain-containing protein [Anaerolineales bacterium]